MHFFSLFLLVLQYISTCSTISWRTFFSFFLFKEDHMFIPLCSCSTVSWRTFLIFLLIPGWNTENRKFTYSTSWRCFFSIYLFYNLMTSFVLFLLIIRDHDAFFLFLLFIFRFLLQHHDARLLSTSSKISPFVYCNMTHFFLFLLLLQPTVFLCLQM